MTQKNILTPTQYTRLLKDIRRIIEEGREKASRATQQELVKTYWNIGRRISEEGLTENAGYGESVLEDLAEELDMDGTTLSRCVHFFQTHNLATSSKNLSWSHFKYLLPIRNEEKRQWYEEAAEQENWNTLQLGRAIKEDRYARSRPGKDKQTAAPRLKRPVEGTYLYKALVERAIDGDTLLLRIDLGFQVFKEQRLRLEGIDTPPMDEAAGKQAFRYVRDRLAGAAFVMVKTHKIDIYGRYVGHVFYLPDEKDKNAVFTKGRYLNQELLDRGLARIL